MCDCACVCGWVCLCLCACVCAPAPVCIPSFMAQQSQSTCYSMNCLSVCVCVCVCARVCVLAHLYVSLPIRLSNQRPHVPDHLRSVQYTACPACNRHPVYSLACRVCLWLHGGVAHGGTGEGVLDNGLYVSHTHTHTHTPWTVLRLRVRAWRGAARTRECALMLRSYLVHVLTACAPTHGAGPSYTQVES